MNHLKRLKSLVDHSKRKTKKIHEEVVFKRAKKKENRPKSATDVEIWFKLGITKLAGQEIIISEWSLKEKTLAKKLLNAYKPELVEKAVEYMCDNWEMLKRKGLYGVPNVSLLYGMRHTIFSAIQVESVVMNKKDSDEFDGEKAKKAPRVGW